MSDRGEIELRSSRPGRDIVVTKTWIWPAAIVVGLTLVVLVNIGFVYIAVSGADEVVPSYLEEER